MQYFVSFPVLYHLNDEEKVGCFTLFVFLISCDYKCCVFPLGVVCIVCDSGIFWSYSLTFLTVHKCCDGHFYITLSNMNYAHHNRFKYIKLILYQQVNRYDSFLQIIMNSISCCYEALIRLTFSQIMLLLKNIKPTITYASFDT